MDSFDFSFLNSLPLNNPDVADDSSTKTELSQQTESSLGYSSEISALDHQELNLFSQNASQLPQSQRAAQSKGDQCPNCGAVNALQVDRTGNQICSHCSHIVQVWCHCCFGSECERKVFCAVTL